MELAENTKLKIDKMNVKSIQNAEKKPNEITDWIKKIDDLQISSENHLNDNFTLSIKFNSEISKTELGNIFDQLSLNFEFISLNNDEFNNISSDLLS